MIKKKDLSKSNKITLLLLFIFLSFACILPNASSGGNIPEVENTRLPTLLAITSTAIPPAECSVSGIKDKTLAVVDASPDGLRIRKTQDGEELNIIPHQSTVFILSEENNGWVYIGWVSPDGLICGYSAVRYLKTVK